MTRSIDPPEMAELESLRRRLDPEHPDPDHLRRRIQQARRLPASIPSPTDQDLSRSSPAAAAGALGEDRRRWWGCDGAHVLVAANVFLVLLLVFALVVLRGPLHDRWFGAAATPTPPVSTTQPATPPPPLPPPGFRDCSQSLGTGAYCADQAECWSGVIGLADAPFVGTPVGCRQSHVFQTFAAGLVETPYRQQTQYAKLPMVRRLCSPKTLGTVLGDNALAKRFEIIVLPPQERGTFVVRCIAGQDERKSPLAFQPLR